MEDTTKAAAVDNELMPPPPTTQQKLDIEKKEEEKLKSKFPNLPGRPAAPGASGHSSFLQKRLAKGQKFFDSGDYQVKSLSNRMPLYSSSFSTLQMAKQSHRLVPGGKLHPVLPQPTGEEHPTPETVPGKETVSMTDTILSFLSLQLARHPSSLPSSITTSRLRQRWPQNCLPSWLNKTRC